MRSLQENLPKFTERNVRLVAISVDPVDVTAGHCEKQGYTFEFLSDPKAEVVRRYDLLHAGGRGGQDIARPAEFLLDPTGVVRWVNLTESFRVRPKGEEVLAVLDELGVKPGRVARTPNR